MVIETTRERQLVLVEGLDGWMQFRADRKDLYGNCYCERYDSADRWIGTQTLEQAIGLYEYGWADGATVLTRVLDKVAPFATQLTEQEDYQFNPVEGIGIDIGRYTSGQPDCWVSVEPMVVNVRGNRVLRLMFSVSTSSSMSVESIMNYGAAVGAAVLALEMQGYRVELWASFWQTDDKVTYKGGNQHLSAMQVKRAEDTLNVSRLAFVVAHASMQRRFMFGLFERTPFCSLYDAHGYPVKETTLPEWVQNVMFFDCYFPSLMSRHDWRAQFTVEQAEALAIETLVQFQ